MEQYKTAWIPLGHPVYIYFSLWCKTVRSVTLVTLICYWKVGSEKEIGIERMAFHSECLELREQKFFNIKNKYLIVWWCCISNMFKRSILKKIK